MNTPISGYPPPEQGGLVLPTGYPPPIELPSVTPFPDDYVPPPTARPFQLATMTPSLPAPLPQAGEDDTGSAEESSPRKWLCAGFLVSFLALLAIVASLLRRQQPQRPTVEHVTAPSGPVLDETALGVTEGSEESAPEAEESGLSDSGPGEIDHPHSKEA